jgi:hypothetical protein
MENSEDCAVTSVRFKFPLILTTIPVATTGVPSQVKPVGQKGATSIATPFLLQHNKEEPEKLPKDPPVTVYQVKARREA